MTEYPLHPNGLRQAVEEMGRSWSFATARRVLARIQFGQKTELYGLEILPLQRHGRGLYPDALAVRRLHD